MEHKFEDRRISAMSDGTNVERMTPLDTLMPTTYIGVLITFRTKATTASASADLQHGLESLIAQVPWLAGRVHQVTPAPGKAKAFEVRWHPNLPPPTLVERAPIAASYDTLSAEGMPPSAIPPENWPVPLMIDEATSNSGAPVFASSVFAFEDNTGLGLCICMHHNVVDATGLAEIAKLWSQHINGGDMTRPISTLDRLNLLSEAIGSVLSEVSSQPRDSIFEKHPEFSKVPPALPSNFPSCTSKLFRIPVSRLQAMKQVSGCSTTNTILAATIWSAITRARLQRDPSLVDQISNLVTAVNGRQRLGMETFRKGVPYLGNVVLYALAKASVKDLEGFGTRDSAKDICSSIALSQSPEKVNKRHVTEVYLLADSIEENGLFVGWDLFGSRDLTITSWSDLPFHELDFGPQLGSPAFVRVPYSEADGVGLVMPRNRREVTVDGPEELIDVIIMLRRDDMETLEQDITWRSLIK